jgi:U3 small nucleolar ribonucleoprotein protein IMP4
MDDEYERAGVQDPKIFLTTSRDASSRLKQFAKEMSQLIPNCQRRNRGQLVLKELVEACRVNEMTDLIMVYETRGEPGK